MINKMIFVISVIFILTVSNGICDDYTSDGMPQTDSVSMTHNDEGDISRKLINKTFIKTDAKSRAKVAQKSAKRVDLKNSQGEQPIDTDDENSSSTKKNNEYIEVSEGEGVYVAPGAKINNLTVIYTDAKGKSKGTRRSFGPAGGASTAGGVSVSAGAEVGEITNISEGDNTAISDE